MVNSSVSEGMSAAILEVCALTSEILLLLSFVFTCYYSKGIKHALKNTSTTFISCHMYFYVFLNVFFFLKGKNIL